MTPNHETIQYTGHNRKWKLWKSNTKMIIPRIFSSGKKEITHLKVTSLIMIRMLMPEGLHPTWFTHFIVLKLSGTAILGLLTDNYQFIWYNCSMVTLWRWPNLQSTPPFLFCMKCFLPNEGKEWFGIKLIYQIQISIIIK